MPKSIHLHSRRNKANQSIGSDHYQTLCGRTEHFRFTIRNSAIGIWGKYDIGSICGNCLNVLARSCERNLETYSRVLDTVDRHRQWASRQELNRILKQVVDEGLWPKRESGNG